jgi:hypothetical protein
MKWKIKDGIVLDENELVVCILPEKPSTLDASLIKFAPDILNAIMYYCESVESTAHPRNPKKHYDTFQRILERINEENDL